MKIVVKESINFKLNDKNAVDVIENENKISEIDLGLHTILCLFNGYLDKDKIINLFQEVFHIDKEVSVERFNVILDKCKYILEENEDLIRDLKPFTTEKININFSRIRAIVPEKLVISLTKDCFMKCRYCYAGANYSREANKENSLSLELLEKIVKEAKELNIDFAALTGGDPFARKDIFQVLDIFKTYDIQVGLSTKKILTDMEIKKLKKYKSVIQNFQVSIDSVDNTVQEELIKVKNFSNQMLEVIKKLVINGIEVSVNSVVTSLNIENIPKLVLELDKIGASNWLLAPYENTLWKDDSSLFPSYAQYRELISKLKKLDVKMEISYSKKLEKINEENSYESLDSVLCTGGMTGLAISSSGLVSICERLTYNEEHCVGDIKNSSLIEIWNSPKLKEYMKPSKEKFKGTGCYNCENFDLCVYKRGICYVNSLIINNKLFSPDNCPFNKGSKRII